MNQSIIKFVSILMAIVAMAQAVPVVVTRYHTADAVTVTQTSTTGTTTVTLPVVEIFISNGVTYTYTLTSTATATGDLSTTSGTQTVVYTNGATSTLTPGETIADSTITTAPTTTSKTATTSSSSSDWTSTTETITLTTTVTLGDGSESTATSTRTTTKSSSASSGLTESSTASTTAKFYTTTSSSSSSSSTKTTTTSKSSTHSTTKTSTSSSSSSSSSSTSSSATSSDAAASSAAITSKPTAIVYSPYNDDGSCKGADTVYSDLELIKSKDIPTIRMYGTDCNSINTVEPAAVKLGLKINQGFWIDSDGVSSIDDSVSDLIDWANDNSWDVFDYITIGNEAIQSGYCSVDDLISKISSVKSKLQAAGYTGQVTTSEPPVIFEENPSLCTSSEIDFVGLNSHSYFDVNSSADEAGTFVAGQIEIVKKICGDLDILITETGYPSKGDTNGKNVPSVANQAIAVKALLDVVGTNITILSTYNDLWKSPGDYGIEQSFGVIQLF